MKEIGDLVTNLFWINKLAFLIEGKPSSYVWNDCTQSLKLKF